MKIILKFILVCLPLLMLGFLPGDSLLVLFLLTAIFLFVTALLLIIIAALVPEIKRGARPYLKIKYKNMEVSYVWRLNGGGIIFAHEFVRIVSQKIGRVGHVFEYCAGPGFIGFSLLANNLCDRLTLADTNPKAIEAIKETIRNNNLQDKVAVYQSDCLDSIPENEQWDLVVGNPPWDISPDDTKNLILCDPKGRVHEKFYRDVNKFLKPDGSILFVEGGEYTNVNCFKDMVENNGLRIAGSFRPVSFLEIFKNTGEYKGLRVCLVIFLRLCLFAREVYFIWSKRKGAEAEVPPGL